MGPCSDGLCVLDRLSPNLDDTAEEVMEEGLGGTMPTPPTPRLLPTPEVSRLPEPDF